MSVLIYVQSHMFEVLIAEAVAVAVAIVTVWVASPVSQFMSDRQRTLEVVHRHASVGHLASENGIRSARDALDGVTARMTYYAKEGPLVVQAFCRLCRYELQWVEPSLNGVYQFIGKNVTWQQPAKQCDAVRVALGATRLMSRQRRSEIAR